MSADNYLFLDEETNEVWDCVASCVCNHKKHCLKCQKISLIGKGKNIQQAIRIAKKEEYFYEYGLYFELWCK